MPVSGIREPVFSQPPVLSTYLWMRFAELGPQSLSNLEFKVDKELQEGMKIGLNINSMPAVFWPCLLYYYVCGSD